MKKFIWLSILWLIALVIGFLAVNKSCDEIPIEKKKTVTIMVFSSDCIDTIMIICSHDTICHISALKDNFFDTIRFEIDSTKLIKIIPVLDSFDNLLVTDIYIDTLKINSPGGWNYYDNDYIDLLPQGRFIMKFKSKLVFVRP